MDLVNLMYKYINRLINSDELLEKMNSLDLTRVSDDEKKNMTNWEELKWRGLVKDGGKLYEKIFTLLTHNDLIANYCKKMNDYELLEFIVQYIRVPMPPEIDQKAFDELAQIAIGKD